MHVMHDMHVPALSLTGQREWENERENDTGSWMTDARHLSDTYKRGSQYLAVVNITILIYLAIKSVLFILNISLVYVDNIYITVLCECEIIKVQQYWQGNDLVLYFII